QPVFPPEEKPQARMEPVCGVGADIIDRLVTILRIAVAEWRDPPGAATAGDHSSDPVIKSCCPEGLFTVTGMAGDRDPGGVYFFAGEQVIHHPRSPPGPAHQQ